MGLAECASTEFPSRGSNKTSPIVTLHENKGKLDGVFSKVEDCLNSVQISLEVRMSANGLVGFHIHCELCV